MIEAPASGRGLEEWLSLFLASESIGERHKIYGAKSQLL